MRGGRFNPRARYLTGLAGPPWPLRVARRRGLSAYDPRQRYLTGFRLGDESDDPTYTPVLYEDDPTYTPALYQNPSVPSGPILSTSDVVSPANPPTTGFSPFVLSTSPTVTQSSVASSSNFLGLSTNTILLGLGAIALLATVASGRR